MFALLSLASGGDISDRHPDPAAVPARGIGSTIPSALAAAIAIPGEQAAEYATVIMQSGEELHLERIGDLGEGNASLLVFLDSRKRLEHVP